MSLLRFILLILMSTVMISILSGCAPQTKIIYPSLPEYITSPCEDTSTTQPLKYNRDLVNKIITLKGDLSECSSKQKALVESITPDKLNTQ